MTEPPQANGADRERLPERRMSATVRFDHWGMTYYGGIGHYHDGRPGEIFLQCGKSGTAVEAVARDAAVVASIAMQYGAPLDVLRGAVTRLDDGTAAGPLGRFLDIIDEDPGTAEAGEREGG